MSWSEILTFSLVASLLVMSPGPNGVLIAKTVPTSGRAAGFANVAGFVTAFYGHGILSVLGISVLLVQSAVAFSVVKYVGAAYLFWIGLKALMAAWRGAEVTLEVTPSRSRRTLWKAFGEGVLTNGLNPKVSMFYLAAFPQFLSIPDASAASAFTLVTLHATINVVWFCAMVLLLARLTDVAKSGHFQRVLKAVTGAVFVGFSVKLATLRASL
ncbi:LysE family translocator [Shimia sagamensis]|uniref:Threonine/homoserine/homoserine lactone efflux protein n=1 Tax=Shimia sagamensis TaxID=1566352 RepID=A0ABY1NTM7_9RHOB|nr:LysE family translocator [Shimia sagamensis]SMP17257.1 Threonine/homoserine/homoserine lactone efflux protein [Shimia sagamensis]